MKRIYFFATRADVLAVADVVEHKAAIKYILSQHHLFPEYGATVPTYLSASELPFLGTAIRRQTILCERFLVVAQEADVLPLERTIGVKRITAYEAGNCADCVEFNTGGVLSQGILISGLVQTWSDSSESQRLMRLFASAMRKEFKEKVGAFWIGREAYGLLGNGWRLTQNVDAAPFLDVKLPNK